MKIVFIVFWWITISLSVSGQCDSVVQRSDSMFTELWKAYWAAAFKKADDNSWTGTMKFNVNIVIPDSLTLTISSGMPISFRDRNMETLRIFSDRHYISTIHSDVQGGNLAFGGPGPDKILDVVIEEGKGLAKYFPDIWELVACDCGIPIKDINGKIVPSSIYLFIPGNYKSILFPGDIVNWPENKVTDKNGCDVDFKKRLRATERANKSKR